MQRKLPSLLLLLFLLLCSTAFFSCSQKDEVQEILLITTPLFESRNNFILLKDNYARAFATRNSSKKVETIFRKGDILVVAKGDMRSQNDEQHTGYTWYPIMHNNKVHWLYAHDVVLGGSQSEVLFFKNRLMKGGTK